MLPPFSSHGDLLMSGNGNMVLGGDLTGNGVFRLEAGNIAFARTLIVGGRPGGWRRGTAAGHAVPARLATGCAVFGHRHEHSHALAEDQAKALLVHRAP
jgi:hypothetical protein